MSNKLNLSIDEGLKNQIKEYAELRNLSLSLLVEEYFKSLLNFDNSFDNKMPLTDSLTGILAGVSDKEIENARLEYLETKYLHD